MTTFIESQGLQLKIGDGSSPEGFNLIPQIVSLDGPDGSANEIDVTTLDSTAREFAMGLKDSGSITFEAIYNPDNTYHQGLRTDWTNRTLRNFEMDLTNSPATTWGFAAYVQNFSITAGVDQVVNLNVTLRLSGDVTVT